MPSKISFLYVTGFSVASVLIAGFCCKWQDAPIKLKETAASSAGQLLAGVAFLTLIVERVLEVLIGAPREPKTEQLTKEAVAAAALMQEKKVAGAAVADLELLRNAATAAEAKAAEERALTMKLTLAAGIVLGTVASALGVRTLGELWTTIPPPEANKMADFAGTFNALDMFFTATLVAGGSQGMHLLLDAIGDYLKKPKS